MTPRVVVTFIGAERKGAVYSPATWQFDAETVTYDNPFLGIALIRRLLRQSSGTIRAVVLGTPTSAWPTWLGAAGVTEADGMTARSPGGEWTETELAPWRCKAADVLGLQDVKFKIVPYGRDTTEQLGVLDAIVESVPQSAELHVDVTYGMRSHPIIGALASLVARDACQAKIEGVYYGAIVLGSTIHPVHRLDGFLKVADWLAAFRTARATGDFGVFSALFHEAGLNADDAQNISEAAFFRLAGLYDTARTRITEVRAAVARAQRRTSLEVSNRLADAAVRLAEIAGKDSYETLRSEALAALERGDLVRASQLAFEAAQAVLKRKFPNFKESASDDNGLLTKEYNRWFRELPDAAKRKHRAEHGAFSTIRKIRNVVTHADSRKPDWLFRSIFESRKRCTIELEAAIMRFLPPP